MDFMSGVSYFINQAISEKKYAGLKHFDFEQPLTRLIWIAAILCITTSYGMSWLLLSDLVIPGHDVSQLWWQLATIISCGTLAAVLIPELTKAFTSSHSKHVHEVVTASREGGASLTILSGLVAGNFSAFWMGLLITALMAGAFFVSLLGLNDLMAVELVRPHSARLATLDPATQDKIKTELEDTTDESSTPLEARSSTLKAQDPETRAVIESELKVNLVGVGSIFAFGLVAFGFLCMGPVNIAVDSYGPVTDNAPVSVFELAQTEHIPGIKEEIQRDFGFVPDFEVGKHYLEANDSAGNTFKATAKPVLIGTAVVGATTMIFSIILVLGKAGVLALELDGRARCCSASCAGGYASGSSGSREARRWQAVTTW